MLNQYFYALLITGIVHLSLALFVLFKGIKQRINQTYALYSAGIAIWAIFEAYGITAQERSLALLLWRINHMGVIFIPIGFVHFVYCAVNVNSSKRKFIPISYIAAFIFVGLNCTKLLILEVVPKFSFRWFINPGNFYYLFFTIWCCWILYGLFELFKGYFKSTGIGRNQLKYFCWSMLVAYAGGVPNFFPTFNIEIPIIMPFGTYAIAIYAGFTAYAMLKYRLMDVNVALTRVGIFIFVYLLVLGIPLGITGWGKNWLEGLFGNVWYWGPVVLASILATAGPFIYIFLQHRAEGALLKERRRYQETINNLSKSMINIRDIEKLFATITSTITKAVKIKFATVYLKTKEYNSFQLKNCYPAEAKSQFQEFIPLDDQLISILDQRKKPLLGEEVGQHDKINLDSGVIIPCFGKDGLIAFVILGAKQNNEMYTNDDLLVLESLSYNTSLTIENCNHWKEMENRQRMARIEEMHTFSYSLAHEIDNPMTILIRGIEILRRDYTGYVDDEAENKKMIDWLNFMHEAAWRVSGMVKAVQEFGQRTSSEFKIVKLEKAIDTFLNLYLPHFKMNGVAFTKETPETFPLIRGVSQEIEQTLIILAKNAVQALKDTKEKKIHLKAELINSDWIKITLTDNGPGIEKEKLLSVFTAFYTTKGTHEGTGMGLYNATQFIVERHKGKLWAESDGPGKGASFIIELPIAKDIKPEELKEEKKTNIIKLD